MYSDKIRPYDGDEPYIFISYAHKDSAVVLPILEHMVADGYRIWYDEGITPGSEWDDEIALHIDECDSFIAFISNNYLKSENCRDELNFVRDLGKERLLIYIEEVTLPPAMAMRLSRLQDLRLYNYGSDMDRFFEKLYFAKMLKNSKGDFVLGNNTFSNSTPFPKPQTAPTNLFGFAPSTMPTPKSDATTPKPVPAIKTNPNHIVKPRYTLLEPIGHGGMASVYKALDTQTNKTVTVKFFNQYEVDVCPFFTEYDVHNTIMGLEHPSLCKILDSDEIAEPYLVMEYIDGITIAEYIDANSYKMNLNFQELLTVCRQILEALFILHRNNIFYGDVSPYNVMLSKTKRAVLIDYTECNIIGSPTPNRTLIHGLLTSPEKLTQNKIDQRSDIYEFGRIFEKMLQKYINSSYLSEDTIDIYATPVFEIVRKSTQKNPIGRYQSVLEIIDAIDKIINEYT